MPKETIQARVDAIKKEGVKVFVISGGCDTAAREASNYVDK